MNFRNKSNRGRDGQTLASGCLVTLELLDLCAMVFSSVKWGWEPLPHGAITVGAYWICVMGISRVSPVDWPLNYLLLLWLPPFHELKGERCCLLTETLIGRHDLLPIMKNNWLYGLNVNPHLIWYTFKKPGMNRSYKINFSPQLLSSVSFSDLKLNLDLIQLGEILVVVTICQISYCGPNLSAYIIHTHFPLISILSCIVRRSLRNLYQDDAHDNHLESSGRVRCKYDTIWLSSPTERDDQLQVRNFCSYPAQSNGWVI